MRSIMMQTPTLALALLLNMNEAPRAFAVESEPLPWEKDYATALAKAKSEKRPIFLMLTATWCGPCKSLESKTLPDPLVRAGLNEFVWVKAYEDKELNAKYGNSGYPTLVFIDAEKERTLTRSSGYRPAGPFLKVIIEARKAAGLPLTPDMEKLAATSFTPDRRALDDFIMAGDTAGLLAYLQPAAKDELREDNYLVVQVHIPDGLSASEVVCMVDEKDVILNPSGLALVQPKRAGKDTDIRIVAPGYRMIQDQVPSGDAAPVLSRVYRLEPLLPSDAASFSGRVLLPDGNPAEQAIVRICDWGAVTRTDQDGRFHIAGISPGKFLVRAERPGGEFQSELDFAAGIELKKDLSLTAVTTVGIRWALQTQEGLRTLTGKGVQTGEAYFSVRNSRFLLERGTKVRMYWGSDFMLEDWTESLRKSSKPEVLAKIESMEPGTPVFWLFDSTSRRTGLHRETARFEDIAEVNDGKPLDENTYFEFLRGEPVRAGEVYTLRCVRRDCYAKLEVTDVTLQKPGQWDVPAYTYSTNEIGQATITRFNPNFAGALLITNVLDGSPVTGLGPSAFKDCEFLTSVTIPTSITTIGAGAFDGCTRLTAIMVEADNPAYSTVDSVLFTKDRTTLFCYPGGKIGGYIIPDGVTHLGDQAFQGSPNLTTLDIPASVTQIRFLGSVGLKAIKVAVDNPVFSSLDGVLFNKDRTTLLQCPGGKAGDYTIPDAVMVVEPNAFAYCTSLAHVTIPVGVKEIGECAFQFCTQLTSITIPDGVTTIGGRAFQFCTGLTEAFIGAGVTNSLENPAFYGCSDFKAFHVDAANPAYSSMDGVLFNKDLTTLVQYPYGRAGKYVIPAGVTVVDGGAFAGCTKLTDVILPDSVRRVDDGAFAFCTRLTNVVIGAGVSNSLHNSAFYGCSALKAIHVDAANPVYSSIDGVLFNKDRTTLLQYPHGIVGTYMIPASVTVVDGGAFAGCTNLAEVTIPDGVTTIGEGAFRFCTALTSLTIPESVDQIGPGAFMNCLDLSNVVLLAKGASIAHDAFKDCRNLPPSYRSRIAVSGEDYDYGIECERVTIDRYRNEIAGNVAIPNELGGYPVRFIGDSAFESCTNLTSITIPSKVVGIRSRAFVSCTGLASVTIPANVKTMGDAAFDSCTGLTNLSLGSGLTTLGIEAFARCTGLGHVTIPEGVVRIGSEPFGSCTGLVAIHVDAANPQFSSVDGILFNKNQTTLLQYPSGKAGSYAISLRVTSVWDYAFRDCAHLASLEIPASVSRLVFTGCTGLEAINVDPANPSYSSIDGVLFDKKQTALIRYPGSKSGNYTIPASVVRLEEGAFGGGSGLTAVTLPAGVTTIKRKALSGCTGLTEILVDEANEKFSSLDGVLFNKDQTGIVSYPGGKAAQYALPDSVKGIWVAAFSGCTGLTSVILPEGVTFIGRNAFEGCTSLASINLPESGTVIGKDAFKDCPMLPDPEQLRAAAPPPPAAPFDSPEALDQHLESYKLEALRQDLPPIPLQDIPHFSRVIFRKWLICRLG